jgi:quercetin dioxygenase-like cupin family protein
MSHTNEQVDEIFRGEGWRVATSIDALGDGMFRRVRHQLDVTAFGINVKVMEPDSSSRLHLHTEQQEVLFVHSGSIKLTFDDGASHDLRAGAIAVIDPGEAHVVRVTSHEPAILLMMGGKDGVVENDAVFPD